MLGDPRRLRTRNSYGYLVGRKHKLRVGSEDEARALAKRLLADPHNAAQLRAGLGDPHAALEELESWLASGLASGGLLALKTKPAQPTFIEAHATDLTDLLPPEQPQPTTRTGFVDIVLTEHDGTPVSGEPYRLRTPDFEEFRETLDDNGRAHHDPVARSVCRVSFPKIDKGDWKAPPGAPALEPAFLDVIVTDEEGKPIPGAQWALELPGGIEESGVADGSGRIFLPTIEFASVGRLVVTPPSPA